MNIGLFSRREIHRKLRPIVIYSVVLMALLANQQSWGQNYAVSLDGSGDYITIPNDPNWAFGTGEFTISFWMTLNNLNLVHDGLFAREDFQWIALEYNHDYDHRLNLWIDNNGANYWELNNLKSNKNDWIAGTWYHIAVVRNGNQVQLFIDGEMDNSTTYTQSVYNPSGVIYFGRSQLSNRFHNGMLDDIRILNYACTAVDLQSQMSTPLQGNEPGLKGYWNVDVTTGMIIPDLTIEGNNATLVGDAVFVSSTSPMASTPSVNAPFSPVDPTGLPYSVVITGGTLNGSAFPENTMIGLYQGSLCVGAALMNPAGNTQVVAWRGDASQSLPGFTNGSPITVKIRTEWFSEMQLFTPSLTWSQGNGTFGYGSFSAGSLSVSTTLLPSLTLSASSFNFNAVPLGVSVTDTLIISNPGTALLTISSLYTSNYVFTVSDSYLELAPGESDTIVISFSPAALNVYNESLVLQSNNPASSELIINLYGSGLPIPTPSPLLSPGMLNFGNVLVGSTTSLGFSIINAGNGELIVNSISSSNPAFTVVSSGSFALSQNQNQEIEVAFSPVSVMNYAGNITISTNAGNLIATLNGFGYAGSFNPVQPTGLPYTIIVENCLIDSLFNLSLNDEVAVFDDTLCVGTGYLAGAGQAASFDGNGDYLYVPVNVSENSYTVEMWFRTSASNTGLYSVTGGGHDRHIYLSGGNIYTRVYSNEVIHTQGINYADGNWHHVAHVYGGSQGGQRIYVDGVLKVQGSKAYSDFYWQSGIHIGYSEDLGYFNGEIDEVRVWSVARTQAQITENMYNTFYVYTPELQAYFKMDGNANDYTSNAYTPTYYGNVNFISGSSFINSDFIITAWQGDASQNLPGFTPGNPMSFKILATVYDSLVEMQATPYYSLGTGNFGYAPYTVVSLQANSGLKPIIGFSTLNHYCGQVELNQTITSSFQITNTGNAPADFNLFENSEVFSVSPSVGIINPSESVEVTVTFSPWSAGNHFTELQVSTNDPEMLMTNVVLQGFALPTGSIEIAVTPESLNFNGVIVDSTKSLSFNVINTGTSALSIYDIVSSNPEFTVSTTSFTLANTNDNQLVTVTFVPTKTGLSDGYIHIYSNTYTISIAISGVGYSGYFSPIPSSGIPYTIIIYETNLAEQFSIGDEIGIFDGNTCVGSGPVTATNSLQLTVWQQDVSLGLQGFVPGDSIQIKAWVDINGFKSEIDGVPDFILGDGTFGFGFMTVMNVDFLLPHLNLSDNDFFFALDEPDSTSVNLVINNAGSEALMYQVFPGELSSGNYLSLDGSDDYVSTGVWSPGSQWTLEAWVKPSSIPSGRHTIIGGFQSCYDWGIVMHDGYYGISIRPPGGCSVTIMSNTPAVLNEWTHVAGTVDGLMAKLFINGELLASAPVETSYSAVLTDVRIGGEYCCSGNNFPGIIDEVQVWNFARSLEDIQTTYFQSVLTPQTGLIGYWNFNDGSLQDLSGNGHSGTFFNGASLIAGSAPTVADWISFSVQSDTIPAGASVNFPIEINSSGLIDGMYFTSMWIHSNDPSNQLTEIPVTLNVTGTAQISVSPAYLNFSELIVGETEIQALSIMNIGTDSLWVDSISILNGNMTGMSLASALSFPIRIAPLDEEIIQISFSPISDGTQLDSLLIFSDASNANSLLVLVSGIGLTPPDIALSASSWSDTLPSGSVLADTFYVHNHGQAPLSFTIQNTIPWLSMEPSDGFIQVDDSLAIIMSISSLQVYAGSYSGFFHVISNDPDSPDLSFAMNLQVTGEPLISGISAYDFGIVNVGESGIYSYSILNSGTDTLQIDSIQFSNNAFSLGGPSSFSIAAGDSQAISVVFVPLLASLYSGTMSVYSNDASGTLLSVNLQGLGNLPPVLYVNFDTIEVEVPYGSAGSLEDYLSNIGGEDLTYSISLDNPAITALNLDGSGDYINIVNSLSLNPDTALTIEAWIYPSDDNQEFIVAKEYSSVGSYRLFLDENGNLKFMINGNKSLTSSVSIPVNQWTHVAASSNGRIMQIFINGILDAEIQYAPFTIQSNTYNLRIGRSHANEYFAGSMDELRIWSVYKNETEISAWMNQSLTGAELGLILNLNFNEAAGNIVQDLSSANNDGTLYGNASRSVSSAPVNDFLEVSPMAGTLSQGNSQTLTFNFQASSLSAGNFARTLWIQSNDPELPEVEVPVLWSVTGSSMITASVDSLYFEDTYMGQSDTLDLVLYNSGPVSIDLSSWSFSSDVFSVDFEYPILYPLSEKRMKVFFSPDNQMLYEDTLFISCNASNISQLVIPLHASGLEPPHISLNMSSVSTTLDWGETENVELLVINSGDGPLNWFVTGYDAGWLSLSTGSWVVSPNDTTILTLIFNGLNDGGTYTSNLVFNSNDYTQPQLVLPVSMTLNGSSLSVSKDSLSNWVTYQETISDTLFIRNIGVGPLDYQLSENASWFSCSNYLGSVSPGDSAMVVISYDGNNPHGDYLENLTISSNDYFNPTQLVPIHLQILHATLVSIPSSLSFGYAVKNVGKSSSFTLLNNGNVDLTIDSIYSVEPFTPASSYNTFLPAGQSLSVPVFFLPAATLIYNEIIYVATSIGTFAVPVHGIGENPAPAWYYSFTMYDFGLTDAAIGESVILTIYNTGNVPWVMDDWDISEEHFTVSDTIFSLNPGQSKSITISFLPTAIDIYEATLLWTSNAIGTQEVLLDGRGFFLSNSPVLTYVDDSYYSGVDGVYPLIGSTSSYFQYKVIYTDADNHAPMTGYPIVGIDKNGDADFLDSGEDEFQLFEVDATDADYSDGKEYVFTTTLPLNYDLGYSFFAYDVLGNPSIGEGTMYRSDPFVSNDLLDLSIYANDINFSDLTPAVGQVIQITATVHNNSDYPAENFTVRFYEEDDFIYETTIAYLAAQSQINITINHVFPIDEYYPIKVMIDEDNYVLEDNELNNFAIRPVLVGEFSIPGLMVATAAVTPSVVQPYNTLNWYGHAEYVGSYDPNALVAGAQVTMTIVETGHTFTTYTNSNGDFSVYFQAPATPGVYTIQGMVTDFTLTAITNTVYFQVYVPAPVLGPDLAITYWWGTDIHWTSDCRRIGDDIEVTAIVTNIGNLTAYNPLVHVFKDNSLILTPVYDSIPAGTNKVITFTVNYATVGYHSVSVDIDPYDAIAELNEWNNYGSRTRWIYPLEPDVSPTYAWASDYSPLQDQPVHFTFQIDNLECTTSPVSTAYLYHIFDGDTTFIESQPIDALCATCYDYLYLYNQSYSEVGYHKILIITDPADLMVETNEFNNQYVIQFYVEQAISDLYISDISFSAYNPDEGDLINFTATIWNNGTADASDFYVRFYSDGVQIGDSVYVAYLPHGVNVLVTSDPWLVTDCGHMISATVDEDEFITETNEFNNQTSRPAGYDFAPSLWPFYYYNHISVLVGTPLTLRSRIYNNGTFDADTVYVSYVLNNNLIAYDGVPFIHHQSYASSGHIYTFTNTGTYAVYIYADRIWTDDTRYCELDETNNVVVLYVTVYGEDPDLRVLSQHISPTELNPDPNESINIYGSFENIGNVPAGPFYVKFYANSVQLGDSIYVPGLAAHEDSTVACTQSFASNLIGTHIIRVVTDVFEEVVEIDELNNEASRAIIVGDAPDHMFSDAGDGIWLSDTLPALGDLITINAIVENNGGATGMADLSYYLVYQGDTTLIDVIDYTAAPYDSTDMPISWTVSVPYGRIIARISNANPEEFNIFNNETSIDFGSQLSPLSGNITASDTLICIGETVSLAVTPSGGMGSYVVSWTSNPLGLSVVGTSVTVNPEVSTTYTCTINDGLQEISLTVSIVVQEFSIDLGDDVIACGSGPVWLDAGSHLAYEWSTEATTQTLSVTQAGVYSVSVQGMNGCWAIDEVMVSFEAIPYLSIYQTAPLCLGDTTSLLATASFAYSWSTGESTQEIPVYSEGIYTVTISTAFGCQTVDSIQVISITATVPEIMGLDSAYCEGNPSVMLTAIPIDGSFTGLGINGNVLELATLPAGLYSLEYAYVDTNGCMGETQQDFVIHALPQVSIVGLNNHYYLDDEPDTLVGNPIGGLFAGTGIIDGIFYPAIAGIGVYTISYAFTNEFSCFNSDSLEVSVTVGFDIQGTLRYANNISTPLSDVLIQLTQNNVEVAVDTTNTAGEFLFAGNHNGLYGFLCSSSAIAGGMNATDALLVRRHVVMLDTLDMLPMQAADVNASGSLSAADALLILRRTVGLISTFPAGEWTFEDASVLVDNANVSIGLDALCMGDINASYLFSSSKSENAPELIRDGIMLTSSDLVDIPIYIHQPEFLGALSLELFYNSHFMEVISLSSEADELIYRISEGKLQVALLDVDGLQTGEGTPVIYIKARVFAGVHEDGFDLSIRYESADIEGIPTQSSVIIPRMEMISMQDDFTVSQNFPNPFHSSSTIQFTIPEDGFVRLSIFNALGQEIWVPLEGNRSEGVHSIELNGLQLAAGVYQYVLVYESNNQLQKKSYHMIVK